MKTIAKSIILIAVMLLYGSCSKIVQESPETITISGHITDEDGQPVENVSLDLMYITRMNLLGFYYVQAFTRRPMKTAIIPSNLTTTTIIPIGWISKSRGITTYKVTALTVGSSRRNTMW